MHRNQHLAPRSGDASVTNLGVGYAQDALRARGGLGDLPRACRHRMHHGRDEVYPAPFQGRPDVVHGANDAITDRSVPRSGLPCDHAPGLAVDACDFEKLVKRTHPARCRGVPFGMVLDGYGQLALRARLGWMRLGDRRTWGGGLRELARHPLGETVALHQATSTPAILTSSASAANLVAMLREQLVEGAHLFGTALIERPHDLGQHMSHLTVGAL